MLIHASFVQYTQSEVLVLLMRLAEELYFERNDEVLLILDLISRMVTFNTVFFFIIHCWSLYGFGKVLATSISVFYNLL